MFVPMRIFPPGLDVEEHLIASAEPPNGVTLRDIGRALGISHVTVSLALRNHPKIPETRRRQIRLTAHRMGYLPNATATALSYYKRDARDAPAVAALGWLNIQPEPRERHRQEEVCGYKQAAAAEAERLGYRLEGLVVESGLLPGRLASLMAERRVNGLLIPPLPDTVSQSNGFPAAGLPTVRLGRPADPSPIQFVASDDVTNAATAFEKTWARGYQRIGLVLDFRSAKARFSTVGYLLACSDLDRALVVPPLELPAAPSKKEGTTLNRWIERYRLDAVLVEHPALLERATNDRLPARIGVAFLDVAENGRNDRAGIRRNIAEVGRVAVLALALQINHQPCGLAPDQHNLLIEGTWVNGPSLP
jgi:LacI family transcriptional regulator